MPRLLAPGPHGITLQSLDVYEVPARAMRALASARPTAVGPRRAVELALERARGLPVAKGRLMSGSQQLWTRDREAGQSEHLAPLLAGATEISLYIVSLGADWDSAIGQRLDRDEAAEAYFLDQVAALYVDASARATERKLEADMARDGYVRAPRVRPGYRGQLPLASQHRICELLDAQRLGIRVTEDGLLVPTKTVTGILGWIAKE